MEPSLAMPHYHWGICMVCYTPGSQDKPLKRCSRCHCMFYCGSAHQKIHWKQHKRMCNYLNAAADEVGADLFFAPNEMAEGNEDPRKNWNNFKLRAAVTANILLGGLEMWEKEMFLYPKACRVCHLAQKGSMYDCHRCVGVSYCSEQHRSEDEDHHARFCPELRFNLLADQYESSIGIAMPEIPHQIQKSYSPPESEIWRQIQRDNQSASGPTLLAMSASEQVSARFLTDRLSGPTTLLYAAHQARVRGDRAIENLEEITVHVVGANVMEMLGIIKWEYVLHQLPKCTRMHFVFIGLEFDESEEDGIAEELQSCPDCTNAGRSMLYEIRRKHYHDYCQSGDYILPDLIAVFNCGFHENEVVAVSDDWRDSLKYLVQHPSVPLVFTSYNRSEAVKDLARIKDTGQDVEILLAVQPNPFRSHRPLRDFECDDNRDVFYNNQYLSVVKPT